MKDMKKTLHEVQKSLQEIGKESPDFIKTFSQFMGTVEKDGVLSAKIKELIAISLSVVKQCEWCIAYHVKMGLEKGATREEIMEACYVAALMGGGPSLMHIQLVIKAIDDFSGA